MGVVAEDGSGGIFAGGGFTSIGGTAANRIARWNGTAWSALGTGISGGAFPTVNALLRMSNGDLIVAGSFTTAGGITANHIARWNGTTWSALGGGVTSPGGILRLANGDLVVGGSITGVTGFVGRWNGSSWSSVGNLSAMVPNAFAELGNGDLIAVGFQSVRRWNGTAWSIAGTLSGGNITTAFDAATHPDGSAIVVGAFSTVTSGTPTAVRGTARLDPITFTWSDVGSATALAPLGNGGQVGDVLPRADGTLLFASVPALASGTIRSVLTVTPGCPPATTAYGAGCAGSSGTNVLIATALPWLGTTMSAQCTGLPNGSLSIGVWGLTSVNLPLLTVLPGALPSCDLLSFPDLLTGHAAAFGTASIVLPLDATPSFAGNVIRLQLVTLEPTGAWTSSNGVEFVLGRL